MTQEDLRGNREEVAQKRPLPYLVEPDLKYAIDADLWQSWELIGDKAFLDLLLTVQSNREKAAKGENTDVLNLFFFMRYVRLQH